MPYNYSYDPNVALETLRVVEACRPVIIELLKAFNTRWGLGSEVYALSGNPYPMQWYIQGRGVSLLLGVNHNGKGYVIDVGKMLPPQRPPFAPYMIFNAFLVDDDPFNKAVEYILKYPLIFKE